jgi:hypothetical protein
MAKGKRLAMVNRYSFAIIYTAALIYYVGATCLSTVFHFICICAYLCPTLFPYLMVFISLNSNMTGATSGTGTDIPFRASEFTPYFYWR